MITGIKVWYSPELDLLIEGEMGDAFQFWDREGTFVCLYLTEPELKYYDFYLIGEL